MVVPQSDAKQIVQRSKEYDIHVFEAPDSGSPSVLAYGPI